RRRWASGRPGAGRLEGRAWSWLTRPGWRDGNARGDRHPTALDRSRGHPLAPDHAADEPAGKGEEGARDQQHRSEGVYRLAEGLDRQSLGVVDDGRGQWTRGLEEEQLAVEWVRREA